MNKKIIDTLKLKRIVEKDFSSIVKLIELPFLNEIRIRLIDDSFIDIWYSINLENRYSYHWERKQIDNTIFRHDNAPHLKWKDIVTFPRHFHNESEENVEPSYISEIPEKAILEMLNFAGNLLKIP